METGLPTLKGYDQDIYRGFNVIPSAKTISVV
jgi:hypothetical protein